MLDDGGDAEGPVAHLWACYDMCALGPEQLLKVWVDETLGSVHNVFGQCRHTLTLMNLLEGDPAARSHMVAVALGRMYAGAADLCVRYFRGKKRYKTCVAPLGLTDMRWVLMPVSRFNSRAEKALGALIRGRHFTRDSLDSTHHLWESSDLRFNGLLRRYLRETGTNRLWTLAMLQAIAFETWVRLLDDRVRADSVRADLFAYLSASALEADLVASVMEDMHVAYTYSPTDSASWQVVTDLFLESRLRLSH